MYDAINHPGLMRERRFALLGKSDAHVREPVRTAMKANVLLHKSCIHEFDGRSATRETCFPSASTQRQSPDEVKTTSRGALYNTCGAEFPAGFA